MRKRLADWTAGDLEEFQELLDPYCPCDLRSFAQQALGTIRTEKEGEQIPKNPYHERNKEWLIPMKDFEKRLALLEGSDCWKIRHINFSDQTNSRFDRLEDRFNTEIAMLMEEHEKRHDVHEKRHDEIWKDYRALKTAVEELANSAIVQTAARCKTSEEQHKAIVKCGSGDGKLWVEHGEAVWHVDTCHCITYQLLDDGTGKPIELNGLPIQWPEEAAPVEEQRSRFDDCAKEMKDRREWMMALAIQNAEWSGAIIHDGVHHHCCPWCGVLKTLQHESDCIVMVAKEMVREGS